MTSAFDGNTYVRAEDGSYKMDRNAYGFDHRPGDAL